MSETFVYEFRRQGEIISTGTMILELPPGHGETLTLGALSGTVVQVIEGAEKRLVIELD